MEVVIWALPVTTGVPVMAELPDEEDPVVETSVDEAVLPWVEEDSEEPDAVDEVSEPEPLEELVTEVNVLEAEVELKAVAVPVGMPED